MGQMKQVPWVGGYALHDAFEVSSQDTVNYYPEQLPADGTKVQTILRMIPGSRVWKDLGATGTCRGMTVSSDGTLYVCYGGSVYRVKSDKTVTEVINIGTGVSRISWASNGTHLVFCDGQGMWATNLTTLETTACNLNFLRPVQVAYFGYRFVSINADDSFEENEADDPLDLLVRNNNKFYYSAPNDPTSWPALNYEVAATSADPLTALGVAGGEMWLFGANSYEPWRYTGDATKPFAKAENAGGAVGCYARDSVATYGNQCLWLGSGMDGYAQIWTTSSTYQPVKVSTPQIDQLLSRTKEKGVTVTDAIGWVYTDRGHTFYMLSFVQGDFTLCFDLTNSLWSRRSSRHPTLGTERRWNYVFSANAYDKTFVADERNPSIMLLTHEANQEYDQTASPLAIRRMHRGPIYWSNTTPMIINAFRLDMQTGVGTATGQGLNPRMQVRCSNDAGHTYGTERTVPIGKVGEYRTVVEARRFGVGINFVFETAISDPVRADILGAWIDAEPTSKR